MVKDDTIAFGKFNWRVIDIQNGRVLIITQDIVELRWYHDEFVEVTWADCEIRKYLNGEFYNSFNQSEKAKIAAVCNRNPDNPWFRTRGGNDTNDCIFLLSIEEVCQYFGNSTAKLRSKGSQIWHIDDENNGKRQAAYSEDFHWWRLRSPGYYSRTSASISNTGYVYVRGNGVYGRPRDSGGIRPALWLKLDE